MISSQWLCFPGDGREPGLGGGEGEGVTRRGDWRVGRVTVGGTGRGGVEASAMARLATF